MDFNNINRRGAFALLGAAIPGVLLANQAEAAPTPTANPAPAQPEAGDAFSAPAPSALVGLAANRYRVTEASPVHHGAFQLTLADDQGDSFQVDVCAFDGGAGAPRGPARTSYLELFLVNSGHGESRTHEGRGLAVMALAPALQHLEHTVPVAKLLPLRDRQRLFREHLY